MSLRSRMAIPLFAALLFFVPALARASSVNAPGGVAVGGYDPVAYFTMSKPTPGNPAITATYEGATYLFASTRDRDLFVASPEKYIPQYGGFCAYGTAFGHKAPIDPEAFTIIDGRLYLNYDKSIWATFNKDPAGYIGKANTNWPTVQYQPDP